MIDISHDAKTGTFRFSYKRHVYIALGLLFVASGLATFTGPWWQGILEALLGKVHVVVESKYQWAVGGIQVAVGLTLLAYKHFVLDVRQAKLDADKAMIKHADLGIDQVRNYLSCLVDDHSYKSSLHSHFHEVHTRYVLPEFSFQDKKTASLYGHFSSLGNELETFVGTYFWVFPKGRPVDGDFRYCLAPHWNMDREMTIYDSMKVAEYDALKVKLHQLVQATSSSFSAFVARLKELGHV
ncbi:hypothetical protein J2X19_002112 [Rhodoferax ferrireducens]|uniref:Uncharacterized protein n=1 Tax=Rhodoferax ferrireducens TaxID=192843 RepID=A0ABU2C7Z3_9BURK|nr:hypothetical protein [Rhodoferax ferrireducens]MDR7377433.1 hypothetical protein [Rhodoferax ferrireducens]